MTRPERRLPTRLIGSALWRGVDEISLDRFRLEEFSGGLIISGRVLAAREQKSIEVHYTVLCNPAWETIEAHVTLISGENPQQLHVRRDSRDQWWREESPIAEVAGATDIDISITPATNTLPIRRLALQVGESRDVDAAWVRIPELTLSRLSQRYTRTGERSYRYESGNGSFKADLEVDAEGIVLSYGSLWENVAS